MRISLECQKPRALTRAFVVPNMHSMTSPRDCRGTHAECLVDMYKLCHTWQLELDVIAVCGVIATVCDARGAGNSPVTVWAICVGHGLSRMVRVGGRGGWGAGWSDCPVNTLIM